MYEAKGMVSIVDAAYLRRYLRIDDTSEDLFLEELGCSATEKQMPPECLWTPDRSVNSSVLEHRLKRHIIARGEDDSDAVCSDKADVPAALRVWVGACVAFAYANRESDSEKSFKSTPFFERMIDPWRAYK